MKGTLVAGRYRLERLLGAGAMATVWLAEDSELGRRVALKLLAPHVDRARAEREAHAAAALEHPNVCRLFDYGATEEGAYMVLELLPGGTLEDRLREGPLDDANTARIAREVAAGLAHAHARGLVHRDLKPANVLFDGEGNAKISDFGVARMAGVGTLTDAGTIVGTAAYLSPEQAAGEQATPASDVYSFGVLLYRMLTGRLPFEGERPLELVAAHRDLQPPPIVGLRPDAPPRLESVAAAALAKAPQDRPADGAALLAELTAPAATALATSPGPARRGRRTAPLVFGTVALAAAGLGFAFIASRPTTAEAPVATSAPLLPKSGGETEPATTAAPPATGEQTTEQSTSAPAPTRQTTTAARTTAPTTDAGVATTLPPPPTETITFPTETTTTAETAATATETTATTG